MGTINLLVKNLWDVEIEKSYSDCSKCCVMGIHSRICPNCKKEFCKRCLETHKCKKEEAN